MNKAIYDFFTSDHHRLDQLLAEATKDIYAVDMELYGEFRVGLLTHIKMEEKGLFKAAQEANGGALIPLAKQLRLEHGAITSLMVPPPTPELIKVLRFILDSHDLKEEEPGGMYDICANLTKDRTEVLLETLKNFPQTPLHPNRDIPLAWSAAKRACERAGFDYDAIAKS